MDFDDILLMSQVSTTILMVQRHNAEEQAIVLQCCKQLLLIQNVLLIYGVSWGQIHSTILIMKIDSG